MDKKLEREIIEECLELLDRGNPELTDSVYENPTSLYTDEKLFERDCDEIFRTLPLLAGFSCELSSPGAWKTFDVAGVPVVIVRKPDGAIGAYLNVCRHRGARLVDGRGSGRRLTCAFHAWSYDLDGALVGVTHADCFEGMCREDRGLVPVPVEERHGLIWAIANPSASALSISDHLGGDLDAELASWRFGDLHFGEQVVHRGAANWKLAMDTFGENYHSPYLHGDSPLSQLAVGNIHGHRRYGPHHRLTQPMEAIRSLKSVPREDWAAFDGWGLVVNYILFPNSVIVMTGDHAELFQVLPGDSVNESIVVQTCFTSEPVERSEGSTPAALQIFEMILSIFRDQDFATAIEIDQVARSGANETLVFGRNEAILHGFYDDYKELMGQQ